MIKKKSKSKLYFPPKNEKNVHIQTSLGKAQMEGVQKI